MVCFDDDGSKSVEVFAFSDTNVYFLFYFWREYAGRYAITKINTNSAPAVKMTKIQIGQLNTNRGRGGDGLTLIWIIGLGVVCPNGIVLSSNFSWDAHFSFRLT